MVFVKADPCGCQATNARFYLLDNYIDGTEFVALSEAEIKEMVPPIGLAKKIMKLVPKVGTLYLVVIYVNSIDSWLSCVFLTYCRSQYCCQQAAVDT